MPLLTEIRTAPDGSDRRAFLLILVVLASAWGLGSLIASEHWRLLAVVFALGALILRPVQVVLGLYAFLIPFESVTTLTQSNGPADTILRYVGLSAIFILVAMGWFQDRFRRPSPSSLLWSAFILLCSLSSVWAINQTVALQRVSTAIGLWLLYILIASVQLSSREFLLIGFTTLLGGAAAAANSVLMFLRGGADGGRISMAEGTDLADPNFFALTLLLPLSLAISYAFSAQGIMRRSLAVAGTGLITFGIFLTMSRGAAVALGAITLVFLLRVRLHWRLLLPIVAVASGLLLMPHLFFERMQEASATRLAGRQDIWDVGLHSLRSYGLFGAGLDNFPMAFHRYAGTSKYYVGDQRASHNIYLTAAVEFGIPGVLILLTAAGAQLRQFPQRAAVKDADAMRLVAYEAACWGTLVAGFSLDLLWRKAFWFTWAISAAALRMRPLLTPPPQSYGSGAAAGYEQANFRTNSNAYIL